MEITAYLLAGLALVIFLFLAAPAGLRVRYGREGEEDLLSLEFFLWPGIRYEFKITMLDIKTNLQQIVLRYRARVEKGREDITAGARKKITFPSITEMYRQFFFWTDTYKTIRPSLNYLKNRVKINGLTWKTSFGIGDPYHTGMASGVFWSVKGYLISILFKHIKTTKAPVLAVIPDFKKAALNIRLDCIFITRTGYIMFTGFRILAVLIFSGKAVRIIKMLRTQKV
jgi:hypothetical protein